MGNILGKRNGETRLNCFENSIAKFQEEHDYHGELNFLSVRNDNSSCQFRISLTQLQLLLIFILLDQVSSLKNHEIDIEYRMNKDSVSYHSVLKSN